MSKRKSTFDGDNLKKAGKTRHRVYDGLPEYSGFRAADEATWKCGWTGEEYNFVLYIGQPPDKPGDTTTDNGKRYLCLGDKYGEVYMDRQDVYKRLVLKVPTKTYKIDFKNYDNDEVTDVLPVWSRTGVSSSCTTQSSTSVPRGMIASEDSTLANRVLAQKAKWEDIAAQIERWSGLDHDSRSFNVLARFFNPASANTFPLVIAPGDKTWPTEAILQKAADTVNATRSSNPYKYTVVAHDKGADSGRILVGDSFLGLFNTYMDKADWVKLSAAAGRTPWLRPFPTEAQALAVDKLMVDEMKSLPTGTTRTPKNPKKTTTSIVNQSKMSLAAGKPRRPDQKGVMGISATDAFVKFYGLTAKSASDIRPVDSEWLHRSCFSYGGLGTSDYNSSQSTTNLVFGTSETNTDMIRAENEVKTLIEKNAAKLASTSGTVTTEVLRTGNMSQFYADGDKKDAAIPAWVDTTDYCWYTPGLKYDFGSTFKFSYGPFNGLPRNVTKRFDCFSRYRPLLFETLLDQQLLETMYF